MTYKYNPIEHTAKIKAGLETAKKKGKKLGRPKSGKIRGEDSVIRLYEAGEVEVGKDVDKNGNRYIELDKATYANISYHVGVSKSTVQRIINKYKKQND